MAKRGRPPGKKTEPRPAVDVAPSACVKCGSTERDPYVSRQELPANGVHLGQPYNLVILRHTRCKACGQARVDRSFEQRLARARE